MGCRVILNAWETEMDEHKQERIDGSSGDNKRLDSDGGEDEDTQSGISESADTVLLE